MLKTLNDYYQKDFDYDGSRNFTFKAWINKLVKRDNCLTCCVSGISFRFKQEDIEVAKPKDPCICSEYLETLERFGEESLHIHTPRASVPVILSLKGYKSDVGTSIYSGGSSPRLDYKQIEKHILWNCDFDYTGIDEEEDRKVYHEFRQALNNATPEEIPMFLEAMGYQPPEENTGFIKRMWNTLCRTR